MHTATDKRNFLFFSKVNSPAYYTVFFNYSIQFNSIQFNSYEWTYMAKISSLGS